MPRVLRVDPARLDPRQLGEPARLLRQGALVAFPTETVYGLGARATDAGSVRAIFEAKGRPATNPLIVHVATVAQARALVADWPAVASALAARFWPGPLTLVLPRASGAVPDEVTAGLDTVALRIPAHPVALEILRLAGVPVAAPSANRSTEVSPTRAEHVVQSLGDAVDLVVDGGPTTGGIESTVLSLVGEPRVLRPGLVTVEALRELLPDLPDWTPAIEEGAAPSPGMSRKHYSPNARVELVSRETSSEGGRVGVLDRGTPGETDDGRVLRITLPDDPVGYAAGLYAALRRMDEVGCERILVVAPPDERGWDAIRDRLSRAAVE